MDAAAARARRVKLAVQIAVCGGIPEAQAAIDSVLAHTRWPLVVRVWDNSVALEDAVLLRRVTRPHRKRRRLWLTGARENLGFGEAHNRLLAEGRRRADGATHVCFLNSDVTVGAGWEAMALAVLAADPQVGAAAPALAGHLDLEGSCLFMREPDAATCGPFDAARFPLAYSEDADLCRRLRIAGCRLALVPVPGFTHGKSRTAERLQTEGQDIRGQMVVNAQTFAARWDRVPLVPMVLVARRRAIGDLLCMTPALAALKAKSPDLPLVVATDTPEPLLGNPVVHRILPWQAAEGYRARWLDGVERPGEHLVDAFCRATGVPIPQGEARRPQLYLSPAERAWAAGRGLPRRFVAIAPESGWRIRSWPHGRDLAEVLDRSGIPSVILGRDQGVPLRLSLAILERAALLVAAESALLHAAAALGVPAVGLYGPTLPGERAHAGHGALLTPLGCRGCYARRSEPLPVGPDACPREAMLAGEARAPGGDTLCMDRIDAERVFEEVLQCWKEADR